jgi:methyl-accepting chemotaxis protein
MQEQSAKLADVVSVFKLDAAYSPPALPRAPAKTASLPRRTALAVASRPAAAPTPAPAPASASSPAAKRKPVTASEGDWEEF